MAHAYERTEIRRRQIADAALEVIAEEGLRSFTMRAIATRVGITDGTIFRHFKSKAEVVLAALDRLEALMFQGGEESIADPLERLERFFRARAELVGGAPSVGRLIFSEQLVHAAGDAGREKVSAWRDRNLGLVRSCLSELADAGRLRADLRPEALVPLVQGLLLTLFLERTLCGGALPRLTDRIDGIWSTLTTVLLKPEPE